MNRYITIYISSRHSHIDLGTGKLANVQVVVRGHPSAGYHDDVRRAVQRKLEPQGFQVTLPHQHAKCIRSLRLPAPTYPPISILPCVPPPPPPPPPPTPRPYVYLVHLRLHLVCEGYSHL